MYGSSSVLFFTFPLFFLLRKFILWLWDEEEKRFWGGWGSWGTGGLVWFQVFVVVHSLQYTFCFYLTFCDL